VHAYQAPRRWNFANAAAPYALATMCIGVGQGIAMALERP
jgi:acetyl-CoA acetyltransferase